MLSNISPNSPGPVPGFETSGASSNLSKENLEAKLFKDMRPLLLGFYLRALGVDENPKEPQDIQRLAQLKANLNKMSDVEFQREVQGVLYVSAHPGNSGWKIEVAVLGTYRKLEFAVEPTDEGVQLRLNKWPEHASIDRRNDGTMLNWNVNSYIPMFPLPDLDRPRSREDIIRQMVERGLPEVYASRLLELIEQRHAFYNDHGLVNEDKYGGYLNFLLSMTLPWVLGELSRSYRGGRGQALMPEDIKIASFLNDLANEVEKCKSKQCEQILPQKLLDNTKPEKPGDIPQPRGGASNPHVYLALQKRLNELAIQFSFSRLEFEAIAKYIARNTDNIEDAIAILNKVHEISGGKLGVGEAQGIIKQWYFSNQNGLPNWTAIVDGIQTTINARKILGGLILHNR